MTETKLSIEQNLVLAQDFKRKLENTVFALMPIDNDSDEYIDIKSEFTDGKPDNSLPPRRYEVTLLGSEPASEFFMAKYVFCSKNIEDLDGFKPKDLVKVKVTDEFELRRGDKGRMERAYVVKLVGANPNA